MTASSYLSLFVTRYSHSPSQLLKAHSLVEKLNAEMPLRFYQVKYTGLNLTRICYLMHAGLVAIYVALVIVAFKHYEHNINYPFTSSRQMMMSVMVTVVTQTFGIVRSQI